MTRPRAAMLLGLLVLGLSAIGKGLGYRNDGSRQEWDVYAGAGAPAWVNDFDVAESCATYSLFMESAGTLVPPQP